MRLLGPCLVTGWASVPPGDPWSEAHPGGLVANPVCRHVEPAQGPFWLWPGFQAEDLPRLANRPDRVIRFPGLRTLLVHLAWPPAASRFGSLGWLFRQSGRLVSLRYSQSPPQSTRELRLGMSPMDQVGFHGCPSAVWAGPRSSRQSALGRRIFSAVASVASPAGDSSPAGCVAGANGSCSSES